MNGGDANLTGKTAVVTGAGRGIGRSIAVEFARAGADIAICARSVEELQAVSSVVEQQGRRCVIGVADLTDAVATGEFCSAVKKAFGQIDILVNNAGGMLEIRAIAESDINRWWATIEVNLKSAYLVTRSFLDK